MTQADDIPTLGAHDLDLAVAQLRERPTELPVEVADRVLERALALPRPAQLVRATGGHDFLRVSTVVLVDLLRQRLDRDLADAVVRRIRCWTSRDERLEGVTVDLVARYGSDLRALSARTHEVVDDVVRGALGGAAVEGPDAVRTHVHVSDVTLGDPRVTDPYDED